VVTAHEMPSTKSAMAFNASEDLRREGAGSGSQGQSASKCSIVVQQSSTSFSSSGQREGGPPGPCRSEFEQKPAKRAPTRPQSGAPGLGRAAVGPVRHRFCIKCEQLLHLPVPLVLQNNHRLCSV
jgi:hypothetical protein